jgi:hypothetical protein
MYKPSLEFTPEEAACLVGKRLLVGITHRSLKDVVVSHEQFHGVIDRINLKDGLVVRLEGSGEERAIPPDLGRLQAASPGEYRLKSTGEVVKDPDYTVMWTLYPKGYEE